LEQPSTVVAEAPRRDLSGSWMESPAVGAYLAMRPSAGQLAKAATFRLPSLQTRNHLN